MTFIISKMTPADLICSLWKQLYPSSPSHRSRPWSLNCPYNSFFRPSHCRYSIPMRTSLDGRWRFVHRSDCSSIRFTTLSMNLFISLVDELVSSLFYWASPFSVLWSSLSRHLLTIAATSSVLAKGCRLCKVLFITFFSETTRLLIVCTMLLSTWLYLESSFVFRSIATVRSAWEILLMTLVISLIGLSFALRYRCQDTHHKHYSRGYYSYFYDGAFDRYIMPLMSSVFDTPSKVLRTHSVPVFYRFISGNIITPKSLIHQNILSPSSRFYSCASLPRNVPTALEPSGFFHIRYYTSKILPWITNIVLYFMIFCILSTTSNCSRCSFRNCRQFSIIKFYCSKVIIRIIWKL